MTDDELTVQIAGKLVAFAEMDGDEAYDLAPVLLPVVRGYAADQLDAAANDCDDNTPGWRLVQVNRERATALRNQP
jgi:hypothetical protein